jgi:PAS domain S-box-containing protein
VEPQWEDHGEPESASLSKAGAPECLDRDKDGALSHVTILVCAPTPPHTPFFASGNISSLLGYEPREIVGNTSFWMRYIHTEDAPQLLSGLFHLFTRGTHVYDYRFIKKDGTYKRLLVELHLHRRQKREPIAMMAFLRQSAFTENMLQGRELPAAVFQEGDAALLTIDEGRRIREAGPGIEKLFGRPAAELVGTPALDLFPPDYAHLANDTFNRIVRQEDATTHRFWQAILHGSGSLRYIAAEGMKARCRRGVAIVLKCRNISQHVMLDAQCRARCAARLLSSLARGENDIPDAESSEPLNRITGREREILHLTIEGLSCTQIGEQLSISPRTVEAHRKHIMNKLGVRTLSQLIRYTVSRITDPAAF